MVLSKEQDKLRKRQQRDKVRAEAAKSEKAAAEKRLKNAARMREMRAATKSAAAQTDASPVNKRKAADVAEGDKADVPKPANNNRLKKPTAAKTAVESLATSCKRKAADGAESDKAPKRAKLWAYFKLKEKDSLWTRPAKLLHMEHVAAVPMNTPLTEQSLRDNGVRLLRPEAELEAWIHPDSYGALNKTAQPVWKDNEGMLFTVIPANVNCFGNPETIKELVDTLSTVEQHAAPVGTQSGHADGRAYKTHSHFAKDSRLYCIGLKGSLNTDRGEKLSCSKYDSEKQRDLDEEQGTAEQEKWRKSLGRHMAKALRTLRNRHLKAFDVIKQAWERTKAPCFMKEAYNIDDNSKLIRGSAFVVLKNVRSNVHTDHGRSPVVQIIAQSRPFWLYWPAFGVAVYLRPGDIFIHDANWPHVGVRSEEVEVGGNEHVDSFSLEMICDNDAMVKRQKDFENVRNQMPDGSSFYVNGRTKVRSFVSAVAGGPGKGTRNQGQRIRK